MYHANPCGDCAGGLGQIAADSNGGRSWWEAPLEAITGAVSTRISGSTSPYSPGTYAYGDTGYSSYPAAVQIAPAPAAPMIGPAAIGIAAMAVVVGLVMWRM